MVWGGSCTSVSPRIWKQSWAWELGIVDADKTRPYKPEGDAWESKSTLLSLTPQTSEVLANDAGGPCMLVRRTWTAESSVSTTEVCGVRENSVDSRSPAEPSGQHGRLELTSAITSSTAQQCFQLLGETATLLPPHATLKVCLHVFRKATFLLRKPTSWDISRPLANPVSAPVFLQAYTGKTNRLKRNRKHYVFPLLRFSTPLENVTLQNVMPVTFRK